MGKIEDTWHEEDRLGTIISRAVRDDDEDWTLLEKDYLWLVCEVSRLRGEIKGIALAESWRKAGTA